jgi:hypothetical protein
MENKPVNTISNGIIKKIWTHRVIHLKILVPLITMLVVTLGCAFLAEEEVAVSFQIDSGLLAGRGGDDNQDRLVGAIMVFDVSDPLFSFYRDYALNFSYFPGMVELLYTVENGRKKFFTINPSEIPGLGEGQGDIIEPEGDLIFDYIDLVEVPAPFFPSGKYLPINIILPENTDGTINLGTMNVPANRQLRAIFHFYEPITYFV